MIAFEGEAIEAFDEGGLSYYQRNQEERKAHLKKRYDTDPAYREAGVLRAAARRQRDPEKVAIERMVIKAKYRAAAKGIPFDIVNEDLGIMPKVCPILGLPIMLGQGVQTDNSPSLDRLKPERGYVKGNVHIISLRANVIKSHGTAEEHRRIAEWIDGASS